MDLINIVSAFISSLGWLYCSYVRECPCFWETDNVVLGVMSIMSVTDSQMTLGKKCVVACTYMLICVFRDSVRQM